MMDLKELKLEQDDFSYPNDYFEGMHYDLICHRSNSE